ncbi:MAG: 30S ribosomal protein S6 [Phormidesmis sp. CAN_BIN36]|nr:30S ribosomal protein S6 [Phormidesmis sp. CAN_BIN36]
MNYIYETMYILRPDVGDEAVEAAIEKYQNILKENGAEIIETQHRGKRRLAYEIAKQREGVYIQMNYQGDGSQVAPMERAMRLGTEVIRYMTVKQEVPEAESETKTETETAEV